MARPFQHIVAALLAAFALLTVAEPSRAQETLKPGDVISGRLRLVKTRHPNGTPISAYQIVIDRPRQFAEKDEFCNDSPPQTFHLVVMDDGAKALRLHRQIGKKVAVIGEDFFCSQTAWHIGDAVVLKWRFTEPGGR